MVNNLFRSRRRNDPRDSLRLNTGQPRLFREDIRDLNDAKNGDFAGIQPLGGDYARYTGVGPQTGRKILSDLKEYNIYDKPEQELLRKELFEGICKQAREPAMTHDAKCTQESCKFVLRNLLLDDRYSAAAQSALGDASIGATDSNIGSYSDDEQERDIFAAPSSPRQAFAGDNEALDNFRLPTLEEVAAVRSWQERVQKNLKDALQGISDELDLLSINDPKPAVTLHNHVKPAGITDSPHPSLGLKDDEISALKTLLECNELEAQALYPNPGNPLPRPPLLTPDQKVQLRADYGVLDQKDRELKFIYSIETNRRKKREQERLLRNIKVLKEYFAHLDQNKEPPLFTLAGLQEAKKHILANKEGFNILERNVAARGLIKVSQAAISRKEAAIRIAEIEQYVKNNSYDAYINGDVVFGLKTALTRADAVQAKVTVGNTYVHKDALRAHLSAEIPRFPTLEDMLRAKEHREPIDSSHTIAEQHLDDIKACIMRNGEIGQINDKMVEKYAAMIEDAKKSDRILEAPDDTSREDVFAFMKNKKTKLAPSYEQIVAIHNHDVAVENARIQAEAERARRMREQAERAREQAAAIQAAQAKRAEEERRAAAQQRSQFWDGAAALAAGAVVAGVAMNAAGRNRDEQERRRHMNAQAAGVHAWNAAAGSQAAASLRNMAGGGGYRPSQSQSGAGRTLDNIARIVNQTRAPGQQGLNQGWDATRRRQEQMDKWLRDNYS
ncbi:MAG: hypothetical protein AAF621_03865 [Pseudomonadota bacterium]